MQMSKPTAPRRRRAPKIEERPATIVGALGEPDANEVGDLKNAVTETTEATEATINSRKDLKNEVLVRVNREYGHTVDVSGIRAKTVTGFAKEIARQLKPLRKEAKQKSVSQKQVAELLDDLFEKEAKREIMFKGPLAFLSNSYEHKMEYKGREFKTVEHAYQWERATDSKDRQKVLDTPNATMVKRVASKFKLDNPEEWDARKVSVMRELLKLKFADPELKKKLDRTVGMELIDQNHWHDNDMGRCISKLYDNKEFPDSNKVGRILMEMRDGSDLGV